MGRTDIGFMVLNVLNGLRLARKGWNGKGMYLFYVDIKMSEGNGWTFTDGRNDNAPLLPFIAMKTATGEVVPWLASQTDILATDWEVID